MENIFFNMFSEHPKNNINRLLMKELKHKNSILKNTIKCSEFQYANYTFVGSF